MGSRSLIVLVIVVALVTAGCATSIDLAVERQAEGPGALADSGADPDQTGGETEDETTGEAELASTGPTLEDHWHIAYGFYECGTFSAPLESENDPQGIHTHRDGLIHIHPFTVAVTGDQATVGVFFSAMEITELPETPCADEWRAWYWQPAADTRLPIGEPELMDGPIAELRFIADGGALVFAATADNEPPPLPPSVAELERHNTPQPATLDELADRFRMVAVVSCAEGATPLALPDDSSEACASDILAPLGADAVESAEAAEMSSGWVVLPTLTTQGIDAFNELAAACFERSAGCDQGRIAITVGDLVLSAPQVNAPSFERDSINISGNFTEADARVLADALNNG